MNLEQTESVRGVIDFTPNTDFPDICNKCVIHSNNGTLMLIPREGKWVLFSCPIVFKVVMPKAQPEAVGLLGWAVFGLGWADKLALSQGPAQASFG